MGPRWLRRVLLDLMPDRNLQRLKNISDTMFESSREIYREKKQAFLGGDEILQQQVGHGKDVMSILCAYMPLTQIFIK